MKTVELVEKANKIYGIKAVHDGKMVKFFAKNNENPFYVFPIIGSRRGHGHAYFNHTKNLFMVSVFDLLDLLDEYIETPVALRPSEPEKFRLVADIPLLTVKRYFNIFQSGDTEISQFFIGKTEFTREELDKMDTKGFIEERVQTTPTAPPVKKSGEAFLVQSRLDLDPYWSPTWR